MKIIISTVVPIYNEEGNILKLYKRLKPVLKKIHSKKHEIIFVNDGSMDESMKVLKRIRSKDKSVKIISFSRNFGHMQAIQAGLSTSTGEVVVVLDADLQDPPETILDMFKKYNEGYKVVYGIKTQRKENFLRKFLFNSFYKVLNLISSYKMPLDSGTFSLLDRSVVKIITNLNERNIYFSGLRYWAGFSQTGVVYKRGKRFSGKPASFQRLFSLALSGLLSFSYVPLRLASLLGLSTAFVAFIFILLVIALRLFFGFGLIGWASTLSAILLLGGIQLITLGIIGEYLARIYEEVKGRPQYIIEEKIGFKK